MWPEALFLWRWLAKIGSKNEAFLDGQQKFLITKRLFSIRKRFGDFSQTGGPEIVSASKDGVA